MLVKIFCHEYNGVILVVEVMASRVRSNINIHGISIPIHEAPYSYELRIAQLVDDKSANTAIQEVIAFGDHAGLKLNFNKTKIMPLNITFDDKNSVDNFEWTGEPIRYMGVVLTLNEEEFNQLNWLVKIDDIKIFLYEKLGI